MVIKKEDQTRAVREKPAGGAGALHALYPLAPGSQLALPTSFRMIGRMRLEPGSAVGLHTHTEDEELYYVLCGTGLYTDETGATHQLRAGDATLTLKGQRHALANNGAEPLEFLAVITA